MPRNGISAHEASATQGIPAAPAGIRADQQERGAIPEVLREAERPLSTADCTTRIAERNGVDTNDPSMLRFLTQVSATLIALTRRGRVRQAGTLDCRKHLWDLAA